MPRCGHEVPCDCEEYLNRCSREQLENLRIQFGIVVYNERALGTVAIPIEEHGEFGPIKQPSGRCLERQARKRVKKVNEVLVKRFGYAIV